MCSAMANVRFGHVLEIFVEHVPDHAQYVGRVHHREQRCPLYTQ